MKLRFLTLLLLPALAYGQSKDALQDRDDKVSEFGKKYVNWHNMDPKGDNIMGVSTEKAYDELLKDKKPKKKIRVAVIDGGIDYNHEDLKARMWTNEDEIPDNGKDDDNNGYIDDIHGWNFLGNANGDNLNEENLEYTRIYRDLHEKYDGKSADQVADADKEEFELFLEVKEKRDKSLKEYRGMLAQIEQAKMGIAMIDAQIEELLGKKDYTLEDVKGIETDDPTAKQFVEAKIQMMQQGMTAKSLEKSAGRVETYVNYYLNPEYTGRKDVVGDNPADYNDRKYGNPDIKGPDAFHGTFVAGVIGAVRGNNVGIDGIADHIEIMGLRAVPNGDEYDKDVALSIRYAVDNGANIINMSFGKQYSPHKHMVDDAIKYAESKGVLLVNAAGNDNMDVDNHTHFPIDRLNEGGSVTNMITVGASSMRLKIVPEDSLEALASSSNLGLPGTFSNYGKQHVDIFAPGVDMVSCAPENEYEKANGTSFASPAVAGVAALVWSYYPELSMAELKKVILESGTKTGKAKVYVPNGRGVKPDDQERVKFAELSLTGRVANAYNALKMADKIVSKKK